MKNLLNQVEALVKVWNAVLEIEKECWDEKNECYGHTEKSEKMFEELFEFVYKAERETGDV